MYQTVSSALHTAGYAPLRHNTQPQPRRDRRVGQHRRGTALQSAPARHTRVFLNVAYKRIAATWNKQVDILIKCQQGVDILTSLDHLHGFDNSSVNAGDSITNELSEHAVRCPRFRAAHDHRIARLPAQRGNLRDSIRTRFKIAPMTPMGQVTWVSTKPVSSLDGGQRLAHWIRQASDAAHPSRHIQHLVLGQLEPVQ